LRGGDRGRGFKPPCRTREKERCTTGKTAAVSVGKKAEPQTACRSRGESKSFRAVTRSKAGGGRNT